MAGMGDNLNIDTILLQISSKENISDIHISTNEHIALRLGGEIKKMEQLPKINAEMIDVIVKQLMVGNQKAYEQFLSEREADLSYIGSDKTTYRVNLFFKLGKIGIVLRKIPAKAKKLEDLMFIDLAENIKQRVLAKRQGLFLVTGPTGSGKSTSLVAMMENLNETRSDHIITIEDPIEFIFDPKQCIISQREVGHDTWSFLNALRAAMREDPDIVLVGEIRDRETAEAVLNLAETGHLVFSTLHTSSAAGTVNRFISFFPPEIQDSVADRLSEALIGVQSQRLVRKISSQDRIGIYEIMINTAAIKNNIKKRQLPQIDSIIETGIKQGMISLQQYAKRLIEQGLVKEETVSYIFSQKAQV